MSIKVLLIDDHALVRQGIRMLLDARNDMTVVGEGSNGADAVRLAQEATPDVIIMDLLMPGTDGIAATRQIKALGLPCAILILSASIQPHHVREVIQAGACGYMVKAMRAQDLADAIRRAARGERTLDPLAANALMDSLVCQDELVDLTARELEVLRALARGQSNAKIALTLTISEATVRSHVANVLSKLHLRDRTQAMIFALKRGLVSLEEVE